MINIAHNHFGFIRVGAAVPKVSVGNVDYNTDQIVELMKRGTQEHINVLVFPEMVMTGYTAGDLFFQKSLQEDILRNLERLCEASKNKSSISLVGMPLSIEGDVYNVACVLYRGRIFGIVPKTYIPNYREFYEKRWFASARLLHEKNIKEIDLVGQRVPVGTDILFRISDIPDAVLGIEICEDMWVPLPPSSFQVLRGATIIANLSASNDIVGKSLYRKELVRQQSGRGICSYIYASCGPHESTTDLVFGGDAYIAENGSMLAEKERFTRENDMIVRDIDIEHLISDRQHMNTFGETMYESSRKEFRFISIPYEKRTSVLQKELKRHVDQHPFVPSDDANRDLVCKDIFSIQVSSLAKRLEKTGITHAVIGVSGGLDSTLALLVIIETYRRLGFPREHIHALTMPGFGTTERTKSNVYALCKQLGISVEEIDITKTVLSHFDDIHHDADDTKGLTFQNAQARYRKLLELSKANQLMAIDAGTGDLSEIALGWNTFAGDHISTYNVMGGVPKTLVKYVVRWFAETSGDGSLAKTLADILDTPISPELEKTDGEITQKTEDLIGPYELHDFFLYHFVRWGSSPAKILFLAEQAFQNKYDRKELLRWLREFITRFFQNQWKRSVMPDGPKIGSVALSPRGDWRMPSDADASMWLRELNEIEKT